MTANEMQSRIGRRYVMTVGKLRIVVRVTDVRIAYGHTQYCVTPDAHAGADNSTWVYASTLGAELA